MSVLAGLVSRRGEDVTLKLLQILRGASPARSETYGIATPGGVEHQMEPPVFTSLNSSVALGHRLLKVNPTDNPQPIHQGSQSLIFIGRIWDRFEPEVLTVADFTRDGALDGVKRLFTELEGSWIVALAEEDKIICCRDPIGVIPLYYGFCDELLGIASNAKTLLSAGLTPIRVSPGHIVELTPKGISDEKFSVLENPTPSVISIEDATTRLHHLLKKAVTRTCFGIRSPTLAFSGGIDSVLLANYMKEIGIKPHLTCVGVEDSPDLEAAEKAADYLDMPLSTRIYGETEIDEHLDAILASVEEANPMKIGVAIPLYLVALDASSQGCRVIVSGNGSDELFGGYARYVEQYQKGESVRETMYSDVIHSYEVNFERDWKICVDLGTELRLPYADPELTRFALSLPLSCKLPSNGKEPRKIILRRLASRLGFPDEVTWRPKKAAQYSSGAAKIIERMAKRKGKTVGGYLADRLEELGGHKN